MILTTLSRNKNRASDSLLPLTSGCRDVMVKFSIGSPAIPSSLMVTATSRPAVDCIQMSEDTTRKSSTVKNKDAYIIMTAMSQYNL